MDDVEKGEEGEVGILWCTMKIVKSSSRISPILTSCVRGPTDR